MGDRDPTGMNAIGWQARLADGHHGARTEVEAILQMGAVRTAHVHRVPLNQAFEGIDVHGTKHDAKATRLSRIGPLAREFIDDLGGLGFVVHHGREDLVAADELQFVGASDAVAMNGRWGVDLDAWHEDLHGGVIDRASEASAAIGTLGFVQTREADHGPPDRSVVLGDAIPVVQGHDDAGDDEYAEHRVNKERAALW